MRWLLVACLVAGCEQSFADDRARHVFVPNLGDQDVAAIVLSGSGASGFMFDGDLLEPSEDAPAQPISGGILGSSPAPGLFRPDLVTSLEGQQLDYYEVFSPAIAPFKRVTAFEVITLDPDTQTPLLSARAGSSVVPIEGALGQAPGKGQLFWGTVTLDFRGGTTAPLPTPAAGIRLLSMNATPPVFGLRVQRDESDNYEVVRARANNAPVQLKYLVHAASDYFDAPIPPVAIDVLREALPPFPEGLRQRSASLAARIGVGRRDTLASGIDKLVAYFRSFEESDIPPDSSGDLFWDLATQKKGLCRHRAYVFVIVAQSLGIHARMVQNEAHAWVEVQLPKSGTQSWRRIDLGGANSGIVPHNLSDRPLFSPPDFAFGQANGAPPSRAVLQGYTSDDATGSGAGRGSNRGNGASGGNGGNRGDSAPVTMPPAFANAEDAPSGLAQALLPSQEARTDRTVIDLRLVTRNYHAMRGQSLRIEGEAVADGDRPAPNLRIEAWVAGETAELLGVGVSGANGAFAIEATLPLDLSPGDHMLIVRTPGDDTFGAAEAL